MATSAVKSDLLSALEQIERDKGIRKEEIVRIIEQALASAYRKHVGQQVNVEASIDMESGQIKTFVIKTVVEDVKNPAVEITATAFPLSVTTIRSPAFTLRRYSLSLFLSSLTATVLMAFSYVATLFCFIATLSR